MPVSFKRLYLSIIKPHLLLKRHVRNPEAVFCYLLADWLAIAVDLVSRQLCLQARIQLAAAAWDLCQTLVRDGFDVLNF